MGRLGRWCRLLRFPRSYAYRCARSGGRIIIPCGFHHKTQKYGNGEESYENKKPNHIYFGFVGVRVIVFVVVVTVRVAHLFTGLGGFGWQG